jgi:hypothetical protein
VRGFPLAWPQRRGRRGASPQDRCGAPWAVATGQHGGWLLSTHTGCARVRAQEPAYTVLGAKLDSLRRRYGRVLDSTVLQM